jgi:hypothetical protein
MISQKKLNPGCRARTGPQLKNKKTTHNQHAQDEPGLFYPTKGGIRIETTKFKRGVWLSLRDKYQAHFYHIPFKLICDEWTDK